MAWQVVMDEDGVVTLPSDLIAKLDWAPDNPLRMTVENGVILLGPADPDTISDHA